MLSSAFSIRERNRLAHELANIGSLAGVAVMEVFNSDFETREKADSSPVSDADERAEEIILEHLAKLLPDVPVIAEEQAAANGIASKSPGPAMLLVDPVDGTREFVNRKRDFTVNIGLIYEGQPVAGCVYAPAHNEMYLAGAQAWRCSSLTPGQLIQAGSASDISTRPYPEEGLTAVVSSSHLTEASTKFLAKLNIADRKAYGSSLKFCRIASGEADVYPRWGPTMEWDTAAAHAVLNAAGGQVLTPEGTPLTYSKYADGFRNGAFIAWGGPPLA